MSAHWNVCQYSKQHGSKILLLSQEILDTLDTGIEFREGIAALGALNFLSSMSKKKEEG